MTVAGAIALIVFLAICFILTAPFAMAETARRHINEWQDEADFGDWPWSDDVSIGAGASHGAGE